MGFLQGGCMVLSSRFDRVSAWASGNEDSEVVERIRSALRVHFASGGSISIERALGLPGREAARAWRLAERDFHLRQAARLLAGPDDGTLSSAALAMACQRFVTTLWPRWQAMATPPAGCSELHATLFAAARAAGGRLPRSLKQVGRIVDPLLMGLGPAALRDDARRLALDWDARREWIESEALRIEFEGSFTRYRAWRRADQSGLVRLHRCASDMFSDGDVQRGDLACENTLTGETTHEPESQCHTRKRCP